MLSMTGQTALRVCPVCALSLTFGDEVALPGNVGIVTGRGALHALAVLRNLEGARFDAFSRLLQRIVKRSRVDLFNTHRIGVSTSSNGNILSIPCRGEFHVGLRPITIHEV